VDVGRVHARLVAALVPSLLLLLSLAAGVVVAHGHDLRSVVAPEGARPRLRARRPLPRRRRAEGGGGHGRRGGKALASLAGVEEEGGERELPDHG